MSAGAFAGAGQLFGQQANLGGFLSGKRAGQQEREQQAQRQFNNVLQLERAQVAQQNWQQSFDQRGEWRAQDIGFRQGQANQQQQNWQANLDQRGTFREQDTDWRRQQAELQGTRRSEDVDWRKSQAKEQQRQFNDTNVTAQGRALLIAQGKQVAAKNKAREEAIADRIKAGDPELSPSDRDLAVGRLNAKGIQPFTEAYPEENKMGFLGSAGEFLKGAVPGLNLLPGLLGGDTPFQNVQQFSYGKTPIMAQDEFDKKSAWLGRLEDNIAARPGREMTPLEERDIALAEAELEELEYQKSQLLEVPQQQIFDENRGGFFSDRERDRAERDFFLTRPRNLGPSFAGRRYE